MAFELPDLPYAHDALAAGGMSEETLQFHHDLHHNAYVTNGNNLLAGSGLEGNSLEEVVAAAYNDADKVGLFNNASQHWNHTQFWQMMGPSGRDMPAELAARIDGQFGSGWCWLVKDGDALKVTKTPNGVNPLCFGQTALLGCDVWEHAYYIDFRNKRPVYLQNFLDNLVNWENVAARLAAAGG